MIQIILAKSISLVAMIVSVALLNATEISFRSFLVLFLLGNLFFIISEYLQYVCYVRYKSTSLQEKYDDLAKKYIRVAQENKEYEITIRTLGAVGNGDYIRIIGTLSDIIEDSRYEKIKSKLPKDSSIEEIIIGCIRDLVSEVKELQK